MNKTVILTGLRANNNLHLGNYLGAILPIVDMAKVHASDYQINLFVPDLHSFTTPIDHSKLQAGIMNNLRVFVAAGLPLDSPNINIYRQSYISAHSELAIILNSFTGFGEMSRMTQFKDKLKREPFPTNPANSFQQNHVSVGLFDYPVLMAADILLYGAKYVPVGDDQSQHLEFTRDIAQRMNGQFGQLFDIPKSVKEQHLFFGKDQGLRIRDLVNPAKKMSKSDETGKGVIFLSDSPSLVRKKIMGATTDSFGRIAYNKAEQPGLANLMDLLALMSGQTIGQVCKEYVGYDQYGTLKSALADVLAEFVSGFQTKLGQLDEQLIMNKLSVSEKLMNKRANETLLKVQRAVGLR